MGILSGAGAAFAAFIAGLVPVLVWLAFWLFEDSKKPEPKSALLAAFFAGMLGVLVVLPFQAFAARYLPIGFWLLLSWAATEEITKFLIAWIVVLRRPSADEPIDMPIYLITTALGFSALENALFLFSPILSGHFLQGVATGDLRFIGATLIHVLGSSVIGGALAFAFYREQNAKILYGSIGVILALLLHTIFNSLILFSGGGAALTVFLGVWMGIVFLLLALERVKRIERPAWWQKAFLRRNS
ncbi:MAG: PrsW family intramembrane metalloprotease [Patescibacteria group bacterium]|nr:PrsW family intramembrane metalloprotease [Patescibacteria group bacterium]